MAHLAASALAMVLVAGIRVHASEEPAEAIRLRYTKDALSARLDKAPLSDVLAEFERQSGAEIRGNLRSPREVSAEFEAVPIAEALHRLLGDQNFALVYGREGGLRAVKLLGGPQGPVVDPPPRPMTPEQTTVEAANVGALLDRHMPVPVEGRVADAVGAPSASLRQLVDLSLHHQDATVRAEAVRAGLETLEGDPPLREAVFNVMKLMDDAALSKLLRESAGDRAEEVAMLVLTRAKASEVRLKASSVLQKLRAGD
jgi:hypothetical protein